MAWTIGTKFGVIMAILVLGAVTDICNSTPIDRQTRNDGIENYLTQLKGQTALSGRLRFGKRVHMNGGILLGSPQGLSEYDGGDN